ncbi:unnamed protein product [Ranitomeya imitator]|uniref:SOCS box domain-containing protein n=1 Tax=Ranitomeya imitator TaxID=111125 RepID=A0ABN9L530_9NEOB|nr:unnamed protein product [Ranitomeya imitator]
MDPSCFLPVLPVTQQRLNYIIIQRHGCARQEAAASGYRASRVRSHDRDVMAGPSPIPSLPPEPAACMERSPERRESALKFLIPVTSRHAIQKSGLSPVHSAVDGQSMQCLELLIDNGFDVNELLAEHLSENYGDKRMTALFFAVSNKDVLCTEILLKAGANPNLDPLNCILVAVRSGSYEIVRLLLVHNANVNCYFMLVNDTHFPSAIQYALNDEIMLRMLLNNGYQVERCFDCLHGDMYGGSFTWTTSEEVLPGWTSCVIKDTHFCDFITVSWMRHLIGKIIRVLVDYMDYVPICSKLKSILEVQNEWEEIQEIIGNPRQLKHLCRLKLRKLFGLERLQNLSSVKRVPVPPLLKSYLLYKEYDLYGKGLHFDT